MIILPVLIPVVSGTIGIMTLPYVQVVTHTIGKVINSFTDLNPLTMSILISVTFFTYGYTNFIGSNCYCYRFNWIR